MSLKGRENLYWQRCDPQDDVSWQGVCWGVRVLLAAALASDACSSLPQQPGSGTLVKGHPEHQMAYQRAESNFGWGIASVSTAHSQLKAVSLPNSLIFCPWELYSIF